MARTSRTALRRTCFSKPMARGRQRLDRTDRGTMLVPNLRLNTWLPDSFRNRAGFRFEEGFDWSNIAGATVARAPRSFDLGDQFGRPSTESPV